MKSWILRRRLVLLAVVLALLYWILESAAMSVVFSGNSFAVEMFSPEVHELWMRSLTAALILGLGLYAQAMSDRRHRLEKELQVTSERYHLLWERSSDAMFLVDPADGRYLNANPAAERLAGRTITEIKTLTTADLAPTRAQERLKDAKPSDESVDHGEVTYISPSGSERTALLTTIPMNDHLVIGIARDITERKQMEVELGESQAVARMGSSRVDLASGRITWSNELYQLMGIDKEVAVNLATVMQDMIHPDDRERAVAVMETAISTGKIENFQYKIIRGDGEERVFETNAIVIYDDSGTATGFRAVDQDITDRRRVEEQVQQSQLLASLGEMTAGIAHEVNNPLAAILLYSELINRESLPPAARKDLAVIRSEARRASNIMKALLTYSRKARPTTRRIDIHKTLLKVVDMRQYQEQVRNIDISVDLIDGPLRVRGNAAQLAQVFMNLIINAEEAIETSDDKRIAVTSKADEDKVTITIADSGVGIPEENLSQVFVPFFSTKPPGKGTGLGLATCHGIVTAHGGQIRAENNDRGGATFTVELPLVK